MLPPHPNLQLRSNLRLRLARRQQGALLHWISMRRGCRRWSGRWVSRQSVEWPRLLALVAQQLQVPGPEPPLARVFRAAPVLATAVVVRTRMTRMVR
jgi:hypothetical protein